LFKSGDNVLVMNNLFADIDRCAVSLKRFFDCDDGAINAGAISTGGGEKYAFA
jgi:hypothetical protein